MAEFNSGDSSFDVTFQSYVQVNDTATINKKIAEHNEDESAHEDIRALAEQAATAGTIIVEAVSTDGVTYTAESDSFVYEAGREITVIPNMTSTTVQPFLTLNGETYRIYTTSATTSSYFNGTTEKFIGADVPMKLMFMGNKWKCLNSVRVNVEALVSNGDAGTNKIAFSNGKEENLVFRSHADAALVGEAIFNESGNRYDVLLPGVGNPETGNNGVYKGMEITIIPDVTNSKAYVRLAVNNFDGTASGSQIFLSTGEGTGGYVSPPANFLKAGMPVKLKYTGAGWRITDTPYIDTESITDDLVENLTLDVGKITGTLPVSKGGTGGTSFTANYPIVGNGTGALRALSPLPFLKNIGALGHMDTVTSSKSSSIKTSGVYAVALETDDPSELDFPASYGVLLVLAPSANYIAQVFFDTENIAMYFRTIHTVILTDNQSQTRISTWRQITTENEVAEG